MHNTIQTEIKVVETDEVAKAAILDDSEETAEKKQKLLDFLEGDSP